MFRYEYYRPTTIQEALGLMERFNGDAVYIAGGTDVMVLMRQKKLKPKALISLRNIEELIRKGRAYHRRGGDHKGDPAGRRDKNALLRAPRRRLPPGLDPDQERGDHRGQHLQCGPFGRYGMPAARPRRGGGARGDRAG